MPKFELTHNGALLETLTARTLQDAAEVVRKRRSNIERAITFDHGPAFRGVEFQLVSRPANVVSYLHLRLSNRT
jgi:hypothetical protein